MKTQTLLIVLLMIVKFATAQPNGSSNLNSQFDKILSSQFKPDGAGAAVIIVKQGEVIYRKAAGLANIELNVPMEVDNVFRIASVTKQFTAIAILQLIEQGKISLQDDIRKFVPDFNSSGNKITIEHLLTHTSGIPDYSTVKATVQRERMDLSPVQVINQFKNLPSRFQPGTKWEYSNSGYFLLGYIIELTTGMPYAKYLDENFFKPLGMNNSLYASEAKIIKKRANGYTKSRAGFQNAAYISMTQPFAAGSIQSTVDDLAKWNRAVATYKLVKKETLDKAFTRYKLNDGKETAYGYGWRIGNVYKSNSLWHGGLINGFMSWAVYLPEEDVFVAVLTNCDCSSPEVVASKLAALAGGRPLEFKEAQVDNKSQSSYVGVYENQKGQQRIITLADNKLYSQLGRGPKSLIKKYEKDKFFYDEDAMSTLEFSRSKSGVVQKLTTIGLRGHDDWIKTNKPLPKEDGIKLSEKVLDSYVGVYEVSANFTFTVTKEENRLFLQASGQDKLELFAETTSVFFLKVNDAILEFKLAATGKVDSALLKQGGRITDAKKIK